MNAQHHLEMFYDLFDPFFLIAFFYLRIGERTGLGCQAGLFNADF